MPIAKRRILFLITTADWGGAQHFILLAAKEAKKRGYEIRLAAGETGELEARCREAGLNFRRLKTVKRSISPFADLAALYEIRLLIRDFKPDVVHLNSSKMSVVGSMAAQLEKVPLTIYRIGGWAFLEKLGWLKRLIYLKSEQWSASKKDIIVTVHPADEALAKKLHITPRQKIVTIPNGIDLISFDVAALSKSAARQALGLDENKIVIGTTANFYPAKNLPWYLQSLSPLLQANANLENVIIGDGPERARIVDVIKQFGLEKSVRLIGRRDNAGALLKAFDIFCLPSSKEGMPWALLEAMAAGLPCIATDVGACRWMLEPNAGLIIPPNNAGALLESLKVLIANPEERLRLGQAARLAIQTRFRLEDTINKTFELFEKNNQ
ncbi:MAG: glycosyltransferase family 4 protein [Patescibacteria group bacterium]